MYNCLLPTACELRCHRVPSRYLTLADLLRRLLAFDYSIRPATAITILLRAAILSELCPNQELLVLLGELRNRLSLLGPLLLILEGFLGQR